MEAEADVVGGPVAVGVAENGFEERHCVGECGGSVGWIELVEDTVAKGVEPGFHAVGEWGGAGDEVDILDGETGGFEETAVESGRGVEAGCGCFGIDVERGES